MHLLFLDTETGGLNPVEDALLTIHMSLRNSDLEELTFLDVKIHPGNRNINPHAMAVNQINLYEHNKEALNSHEAATLVTDYLKKSKAMSPGGMAVVAHYVEFDLGFMTQLLPTFRGGYGRGSICTRVLATTMMAGGYMVSKNASLQEVRQALGIEIEATAHDARGDVLVCVEIMRHIFNSFRSAERGRTYRAESRL